MMIFWVLLLIGLFLLGSRYFGGGSGRTHSPSGETALDILNRRLAGGEISEEEYDRLREKQRR